MTRQSLIAWLCQAGPQGGAGPTDPILVATTISYNVIEARGSADCGNAGVIERIDRVRAGLRHRGLLRGGRGTGSSPAPIPKPGEGGAEDDRHAQFFGLADSSTCRRRCRFTFRRGRSSNPPPVGLAPALAVSLAVMPVLSWAQRRAGAQARFPVCESPTPNRRCSALICLPVLLSWTRPERTVSAGRWADPIAALVITRCHRSRRC